MKQIKRFFNSRKFNLILGTSLFILMIVGILGGLIGQSILKQRGRYTITYTQGSSIVRTNVRFEYNYYVNGEKHTVLGSTPQVDSLKEKGGKYFIKFLPEYPGICRADFRFEVPDSVGMPPPEGWEEYPLEKYGIKFKW